MGICHQTVIFFCYDDSTCETGGIYMEVLTVRNLTKTYGKGDTAVTALKNVSFQVNKGEFHCNYRLFRVRQIYTYESHLAESIALLQAP